MTTEPAKQVVAAPPGPVPSKTAITSSPSAPATPSPAKPPLWMPVVTGVLFFGWLGYLIFLVATLPHAPEGAPVVLSRPQFLDSKLDIIAHIEDLQSPVLVKEVFYPKSAHDLVGKKLVVTNLADCRPFPRGDGTDDRSARDFTGPGIYILALRPAAQANRYEVTAIPESPGSFAIPSERIYSRTGPPRIYPDIPATRMQLEKITAQK